MSENFKIILEEKNCPYQKVFYPMNTKPKNSNNAENVASKNQIENKVENQTKCKRRQF